MKNFKYCNSIVPGYFEQLIFECCNYSADWQINKNFHLFHIDTPLEFFILIIIQLPTFTVNYN